MITTCHRSFACILVLACASGCASTSGLLLRPGPHKLLPSAESFSHNKPHSLHVPREREKQFLVEYRVEPGDMLSVEPVDFNSIDKKPVKLVVLLASPVDRTSDHIQALARISRLMTQEAFREKIYGAATAQEIYDLLAEQEKALAESAAG